MTCSPGRAQCSSADSPLTQWAERIRAAMAVASLLCLLPVGSICAQSPETPAHPPAAENGIGLIDVEQRDLLQKPVAANWVSYNGDYTGARYSALTQVTPANAGRLAAQWVFHPHTVSPLEVTPGRRRRSHVRHQRQRCLRARRRHRQGAVASLQSRHRRGWSTMPPSITTAASPSWARAFTWRRTTRTCFASMLAPAISSGTCAYATGNRNYGATSAPLIVKDKVIVGVAGGDDGVRGFLAAFDATNRRGEMALLDHPRPRRKRQRELAGRSLPPRRRRNLDARHLRSRPQHALLGHRQSRPRLRRQRAPRRRSLYQLSAGPRSRYRQAEVVLPVQPAQPLRL